MLSNLEYKLLTVFFAVTLLVCAVRTTDFVIFAYTRSVESARIEKERIENFQPKIQFSACNPCTSYPFETIIPFQIAFLIVAFGLFLACRPITFIASGLILLWVIYGYFDWMNFSYKAVIGSEYYDYKNTSLASYLFVNSTVWDFILLAAEFALVILLIAVLVRFAAQRLHARLNLDDKTPCS